MEQALLKVKWRGGDRDESWSRRRYLHTRGVSGVALFVESMVAGRISVSVPGWYWSNSMVLLLSPCFHAAIQTIEVRTCRRLVLEA